MTPSTNSAMNLGKPLMVARENMANRPTKSVPCYTVRCNKEQIERAQRKEQDRENIKKLYSAFFN